MSTCSLSAIFRAVLGNAPEPGIAARTAGRASRGVILIGLRVSHHVPAENHGAAEGAPVTKNCQHGSSPSGYVARGFPRGSESTHDFDDFVTIWAKESAGASSV
jgi:hypothetical protein